MTTEAIYHKYWAALLDVEAVMVPQDTAIALALRLAIDEAIATHPVALAQPTTADRVAEFKQTQISRLNDWLQVHEPGIFISPGDTADAVLAALGNRDRRIAELLNDLEKLQNEADEEIAELQEALGSAQDAFARLDYPQTANGNDVDPTTRPAWGRNHPAWDGMTDEQRVAIYELHTGRVKFGELSMELRTEILTRVLRYTMDGPERMTMAQFDNRKPEWMPIASGLVRVFGGKWLTLLNLTATPA